MESKTFDAWVTKYALTTGVYKVKASAYDEKSISVVGARFQTMFHGKQWHRDQESALTQAEKMRKDKIASLKDQIARLQALTFEVK